MASPFPGMDPYLESDLWQEFHDRLANQISEQLLPKLPRNYVALLSKRYVIPGRGISLVDLPDRVVYPDAPVAALREAPAAYEVGVAPALELPTSLPDEIPITLVEIRDVASRRLVTIVEILSPANKYGQGAIEYHERRIALLQTRAHLLEIDLLRSGQRIQLLGQLPRAAYYVFLSRFTRRPYTQIWPIQLRDPLPVVPVPLLPPDIDVPLDLQGAMNACFALVHYERLIDYTQPLPLPPLDPDDAAWAAERLRVLPLPS